MMNHHPEAIQLKTRYSADSKLDFVDPFEPVAPCGQMFNDITETTNKTKI
jgi:hypothetical protein